MEAKPTIILDRDGVINQDLTGYVAYCKDWHPINHSLKAIALLNQAGFRVVIATNQSGIGCGYYTEQQMHAVHEHMINILKKSNAHIDKIYYCPHTKVEQCACHKPQPGMLHQIEKDYHCTKANMTFIGDKLSDLQAGDAAGIQSILVKTGAGLQTLKQLPENHHYPVFSDLYDYVRQKLRHYLTVSSIL